ncbi:hypothetical protein PTT_18710 [Pyrenophora teres f. teres 0-1]|uniref:Uncharacterized protein n=1 Tax=Pyrenophora teres f. teres (strain 0-1) TaxID=861557 RepID=E3S7C1_PYRTT|nr:hypothetical protein PTT_18710 [Pyrenophora teres f. teres 0-1]
MVWNLGVLSTDHVGASGAEPPPPYTCIYFYAVSYKLGTAKISTSNCFKYKALNLTGTEMCSFTGLPDCPQEKKFDRICYIRALLGKLQNKPKKGEKLKPPSPAETPI